MERSPFSERLAQIVEQLAKKFNTTTYDIERRIQEASDVYPGFLNNVLHSGREVHVKKFETLEQLAAGMERVPVVFYTRDDKLEDLGIENFPYNGLPENYIGMVFLKYRQKLGMTQKEVACRSRCLLNTYKQYENGELKQPTSAIDRISMVFDITPVYLPDFHVKYAKLRPTAKEIDATFKPVIKAMEGYTSNPPTPSNIRKVLDYAQRISQITERLRTKSTKI